jgi:acyl-CoA hydrolase
MEVFVKIIAEDLKSGESKIAATALLTFVALDQHKHPTRVPQVIPQTEEEKKLHETAPERARIRKGRKQKSKDLSAFLKANYPWEQYSL